MKTLIVYESKKGYTKSCVDEIAKQIGKSTVMVNTKQAYKEALDQYDLVIIGSAIYAGRIPSSIKKFCAKKGEELLSHPMALFMCGTGEELKDKYYTQNYPSQLLEHAKEKGWFGGVIELSQHRGITKMILSSILKGKKELHVEKQENIIPFVQNLKG
jgi:menaquinone-dependent protoporphyrinogen oxidase